MCLAANCRPFGLGVVVMYGSLFAFGEFSVIMFIFIYFDETCLLRKHFLLSFYYAITNRMPQVLGQ